MRHKLQAAEANPRSFSSGIRDGLFRGIGLWGTLIAGRLEVFRT